MMTRRFFPMMLKIFTLVMMLAVVAPISSHAQATGAQDGTAQDAAKTEKKTLEKPLQKPSQKSVEVSADHLYAPKNCEMQIGFPKPPQIQRKCGIGANGSDSDNCTEVVTYREERTTPPPAQVGKDEKSAAPPAAALSSLSVRVTCQDYTPSQLESFNDDVLKSALDQMLREQNYESYRDFTVDSTAGLRRASSMSLGTLNDVDHLYTGQIWKGAHSLFTLEAQMIGPSNPDIEKTFVAILRATHPKQADPHRQPSSPIPDKNQEQ